MRTFELPQIEILRLDISDIVTASLNELVGWDLLGDDVDTPDE